MAKKTERISVSTFEKVAKEFYRPEKTLEWNGLNIIVKSTLSLKEMLSFVDTVVNCCFVDETKEYMPEMREYAIKDCVLRYYTNLSLPQNVERRYDLIYRTDIADEVLEHINFEQYTEMCDAIESKILNLAQSNIEATQRQIIDLYSSFSNLQSQLEGMFSSVTTDDIAKIVGAITNGQIDEQKLVNAYIDRTRPDDDGEK